MKTAITILVIGMFTGGLIGLSMNSDGAAYATNAQNNVMMVNGRQIIEIKAKGGYSPQTTSAKANTPTVLKVNTLGTFDCSASLTIPRLNYFANLPPADVTEIEIPPQKAGTTLQGLCSMGMYSFQIKFG